MLVKQSAGLASTLKDY